MRLSDIMSQMGLESYAEVGLVIFMLLFALIAVRLVFFTSQRDIEHAAHLPLDGQAPQATDTESET
jgi:hypothetical protein